MLENVVVTLAVLIAVVFLVRRFVKTLRQGGCSECAGCKDSKSCSCCFACLGRAEEDAKKD